MYKWIILMLGLFASLTACAKVKLSPLFSDNMVLQQEAEVPVWGKASPEMRVIVIPSWSGEKYENIADRTGNWKVNIKTPKAGGPYHLEITDGEKVRLENVMIGEVWLCSGQSNMQMPVEGWGKVKNYQQEVAQANYPDIRLMTVSNTISLSPSQEFTAVGGGWQVCSSVTIREFSATAYFFGREIARTQQVPVGLICAHWGGTNIESWISAQALGEVPDFVEQLKLIRRLGNKDCDLQAEEEQRQAKILSLDKGMRNGKPFWNTLSHNDEGWISHSFPGNIEKTFPDFDGIVWGRKTVDIPEQWEGKPLSLHMGYVDDEDITYFNGIEIGSTKGYTRSRTYEIPGNLVKAGKAVITVRIVDTGGGCGIGGEMKLSKDVGDWILISGEWKCKVAAQSHIDPVFEMNPNVQTVLYNGMIHPLAPYKFRGVIWYQGENNVGRATQYRILLPLLIQSWREEWGNDFPFYLVQLANYLERVDEPGDSQWAELREAQRQTALYYDNVGMAVTIDIGDMNDIHPKNKQEVGHRLALLARTDTYGERIVCSGPVYQTYRVKGDRVILSFECADGGLKTSDGETLTGFAIAGIDGKYHWAEAEICGNEIIVSSEMVKHPLAVRYGWGDNPACNLINGAGFPASSFQTLR